jgi:ABC-type transporter Mla MlaB component
MNLDALNCRLRNCLATILELEGSLGQTQLAAVLQKEFTVLKDVMQRLENVVVDEHDVYRIEVATSRFLAELKETLGEQSSSGVDSRILQ